MRQTHQNLLRVALGSAALLMTLGTAQAQAPSSGDQNIPAATVRHQAAEIARGDPARWYQEDTTPAQRLRSLHKEIGAALQEAQGACRSLPAAERASCNRDARATYQKEMAGARALSQR